MTQQGRSPIAFLLTAGLLAGLVCLPFGGLLWSLVQEFTSASGSEALALEAPLPEEATPSPGTVEALEAATARSNYSTRATGTDEVLITRSSGMKWLFLQMNPDGTTKSLVIGLGLHAPVLRATRLECPLPDQRSVFVTKNSRHALRVVTASGVQTPSLLNGRDSLQNVAMHVLVNHVKIDDQLRLLIGRNAMENLE